MQSVNFKDKFPLYTTTISKESYSIDELIKYFKAKIESHPIAGFITIFDHYAYTSAKEEHNIPEDILDVKNVIFCFGKEIANPLVPAVRPRSIAIVETKDNFTISFMEAPNGKLTQVMVDWVIEL
jgi:hypothetical protein